MGILDVKYRIILGLFNHFAQVELQGRIVLAKKHHEANRVHAHFINDVTQRYEFPGAFRHFHGLAIAHQLNQLTELDIEPGPALRKSLDGGAHPLHIAAMIGAPNVDQKRVAAVDLGFVIGDIGRKIGVGTVRFHERPVGIVAESRRSEQGLLAILPILGRLPFRRRKTSFIDETAPSAVR